MAKESKVRRVKRKPWTRELVVELKKHSKAKTAVVKIAKMMKRTPGAIRQKGALVGIPLGHHR